jgi:predicted dehydrogenase
MKMKQGRVTFSVVGLGGRASAYLSALQELYPNEHQVVAVADPDPVKQARARNDYGLQDNQIFDTDLDLMEQPRLSDVAIVATQDKLHLRDIRGLLAKGYDLILEKPVATTLEELQEIAAVSKSFPDQMVAVCHVLRHTVFFGEIRRILESGRFGPVVSIQHNENIGYYHFAHSYVRGPWNNSETSGPLTLTKSCHDMDILLYLLGNTHCQQISSYGSLSIFNRDHYDSATMAPMCVDCPQNESCAFSAPKLYSGGKIKSVVFDLSSVDKVRENLGTSPYGRCVYHCDNNVVDHQSTAIQFDNGVTATFNLSAFSAKVNRSLKIMCQFGEIRAIEKPYLIETTDFRTDETTVTELDIHDRGHGGGDKAFVKDFMESYLHGVPFNSTLEHAIESHAMALLAEESRKDNGNAKSVSQWMQGL